MKNLNQKAFAPVEILVVVLILIVLAFVGFTTWQQQDNKDAKADSRNRTINSVHTNYVDRSYFSRGWGITVGGRGVLTSDRNSVTAGSYFVIGGGGPEQFSSFKTVVQLIRYTSSNSTIKTRTCRQSLNCSFSLSRRAADRRGLIKSWFCGDRKGNNEGSKCTSTAQGEMRL